jgi:hypothetical protein
VLVGAQPYEALNDLRASAKNNCTILPGLCCIEDEPNPGVIRHNIFCRDP